MKIHARFSEVTGTKLHVQWEEVEMRGTRNIQTGERLLTHGWILFS